MATPIRILMLEDNARDAELIERHLRKAGLDIVTHRVSVEAAFRSELESGRHDLILADYELPEFDGIAALKLARELTPQVPFIYVSGSMGEDVAVEALRNGAADYILKDRPSRLPAAIGAALARRREQEARGAIQQALIDSERRLHLAANASRDVIWDWALERDAIWVNDALRTEWGYDVGQGSEVDHDWWVSRIHPEDRTRVAHSLDRVMRSSDDRSCDEYRFRRADGSYGYVNDRRVILRSPDGAVIRIVGAMEDISRWKIAERRAADAERIAHLGNWSFDANTERQEWSAELCRIFGYPVGEPVVTEQFLSSVHAEDRPFVERAMVAKNVMPAFQFRIVDGEGYERFIQARFESERDEQGNVVRSFGTAQDVTDRVEADRKIRELSRMNELILAHAADGIVAVDGQGGVLFANPAAHKMLGWDGDAVTDLHRALHRKEESGRRCSLALSLEAGTATLADETFDRSDGESFDVRYTCATIVENNRVTGTVLTFVDVSARKTLERQLDQIKRISGLGRIAATLAHEFNNVLMGIQPFAEIIRNGAAEDRLRQAASQILTSVGRGQRITQDILRTTRVAAPQLESIDLCLWMRQLEPELTALLGGERVLIRCPEEPLHAQCDPAQLQQVVTNLAANARDAMGPTGQLTVAADAVTRSGERAVRLVVTDTGSGIPEKYLPHIFEPLFTTKKTGNGLGLAVVEQLVHQNGGRIEVASEAGKGTTFTILLRSTGHTALRAASVVTQPPPVKTVLLVEDDVSTAEGLAARLQMVGIRVRVVTKGREAVMAAAEFKPDAAIIDVGLPDITSSEVYDRLVECWPDLPVIFSTAQDDGLSPRQLDRPSVRLMHKPYDVSSLLDALREIA
jgi:PAS domain S-box-containing protein